MKKYVLIVFALAMAYCVVTPTIADTMPGYKPDTMSAVTSDMNINSVNTDAITTAVHIRRQQTGDGLFNANSRNYLTTSINSGLSQRLPLIEVGWRL